MDPIAKRVLQSRRDFLTSSAAGLGGIVLTAALAREGLLEAAPGRDLINPNALKAPHFAPKAKACIFLFMAGAPSQIDLFDPKPKLNELDGQPMPESLLEKVRFAFIRKETAVLKGTRVKFQKHGECGTEISNLLPHVAGCVDDIVRSYARCIQTPSTTIRDS